MEVKVNTPLLFSIVVPLYNRPDEIEDLLNSLLSQYAEDIEVIIVEDGSTISSEEIVKSFQSRISRLRYISVPNGGPSRARNIGVSYAIGRYVIILDSDVVLPQNYISAVRQGITNEDIDAFGGPDSATDDFTLIQKAINYAMTSPLTTGGIRGGSSSAMEKFKPRSFNLGCKRSVYNTLQGFDEKMRFGEDIDFSLRLIEGGYRVCLLKDAYVYHKRRVDFKKFFKQVFNSGIARVHIENRHKGSTKLVHLLPMLFFLFSLLCIFGSVFCIYAIVPLIFIFLIIGFHSIWSKRDVRLFIYAPIASFIQLWGYGMGYLTALCNKYILRKGEFRAFDKSFYQ